MVLVKTWSTWVDDNGDAQPGKLSPNQTEELSSDDRLFGKTQRRPDQRIGICRRSLLNQPLRHRSRSQIRTGERNDVPTLAETIQHVPLLFFRVTQIVKADDRAFIEIDTRVRGRQLHGTDSRMDLHLKADESTHQSLEPGRQARIAHARDSQQLASPLRLADRSARGLNVIADVLEKDFLAGNTIAHRQ